MDTHANAATAIFALQGFQIGGRPAKLSWGRDRNAANTNTVTAPAAYDPYSAYNYTAAAAAAAAYPQNWVQPGAYDVQSMRATVPGVASHGSAATLSPNDVSAIDTTGAWSHHHQQQQQQQYYQQYYSTGHNMNI